MVSGRILAIDYGKKRIGLAVTDPGQIIATRMETLSPGQIWSFLDSYFIREKVVLVLIGYPVQTNGTPSQALTCINPFIRTFEKKYPSMPLELVDERFTSVLAHKALLEGGARKKTRQDKSLVDGISATIILQSYLESKKYK